MNIGATFKKRRRLFKGKISKFIWAGLLLICLTNLYIAASSAETGEVALTVRQIFTNTGLYAPPDKNFNYKLTPSLSSNPMPAGSNAEGYAFTIAGTGKTQIAIAFTQSDIYSYELRNITNPQPGYNYDREIYTLEVIVKNDMTCAVVVYKGDGTKATDIKYSHVYSYGQELLPSDPSVMADPPVVKTAAGNPAAASVFTFSLTAGNPSNPMPEGSINGVKTVHITGSGWAEFGTWTYTAEGTYYYIVTEVNTGERDYAYDTSIYTITDSVKAVNGRLEVERIVTNGSNRQVTSMSFINIYTGSNGGGTITPPSTGTAPPTNEPIPPPIEPQSPIEPTQSPNETYPPPTEPVLPLEPTQNPTETAPHSNWTIMPPTPTKPKHTLVPDDDGTYIEFDENGIPVGIWQYDDISEVWVFREHPPSSDKESTTGGEYPPASYESPKYVPKTGDESQTIFYAVLFCMAGIAALGSGGYILFCRPYKVGGKNDET
ncbi:MAG: hypothetical protein FWD71_19540 [Oscillospiraceae bacterium]|nr:hypothetical protein [Oscillospiraceae bacterium]